MPLLLLLLLLAALALPAPARAAPDVATPDVATPNVANNDADWSTHGRPLPEPEFLQPPLDPDLPPAAPPDALRGRIQGSAPAILPALVARWTDAFARLHPGASVDVPPPYDPPQGALSTRLTQFLEGKLPFAFLTRDLPAADLAAFRRAHGYDPVVVPVAGGSYRHFGFVDAVAVIVHRDNPIDHLTLAQLDAIFSETRLHGHAAPAGWGDLGGRPGHPIHVVGAAAFLGEESARATAFRQIVMDRAGAAGRWRRDVPRRREADVAADVAADPDAIGFTGLGHLDDRVKPLALQADGAPQPATYEAIARADYPLARTVTIALDAAPGQPLDPVLKAFVTFCLSQSGQRIVLDQGVFLPLRAAQARTALDALAK